MSVLAMTLTIIVVFAPAAFTSWPHRRLSSGPSASRWPPPWRSRWSRPSPWRRCSRPSGLAKQLPPTPLHVAPGEEHLPHEAHEELGRIGAGLRAAAGLDPAPPRDHAGHRRGVCGAGAWSAASALKFAFLPVIPDSHRLSVGIELPPGAPLGADRPAPRARSSRSCWQDPAVEAVLSHGRGTSGTSETRHASWPLCTRMHDHSAEVRERLRPQLASIRRASPLACRAVQGGDGTECGPAPAARCASAAPAISTSWRRWPSS